MHANRLPDGLGAYPKKVLAIFVPQNSATSAIRGRGPSPSILEMTSEPRERVEYSSNVEKNVSSYLFSETSKMNLDHLSLHSRQVTTVSSCSKEDHPLLFLVSEHLL